MTTTEKISRIFQVHGPSLYITDDSNIALFPGTDGHFSLMDVTQRSKDGDWKRCHIVRCRECLGQDAKQNEVKVFAGVQNIHTAGAEELLDYSCDNGNLKVLQIDVTSKSQVLTLTVTSALESQKQVIL
ncbi:hypothetical protein LDENG_00268620 [Lucifuga dentata]|nr:hypothetical protein LDENG_00268620 [Lucifuga dentata]